MRMTAPTSHPHDRGTEAPARGTASARSAAVAAALSALLVAPAFAEGTASASLQGPSIYDEGSKVESAPEAVDIHS